MADPEDDAGHEPPGGAADVDGTQAVGGPTVPLRAEAEVGDSRETTALSSDDLVVATSPAEPATRVQPSSSVGSSLAPKRHEPTFAPNALLANRYRIVRFIAQGAMGEVYEAEDTALRGRVALKTVRPEIAEDPQAVARFKREIALARLVTHPNVSRIYDLGLHVPAGAQVPSAASLEALVADGTGGTASLEGQILFLTMELLPGETLSSLLARRRRLKRTEALPLLKQIAAGLDAAHAVGVIHRDFKSGNVMLVAAGDRRKPVRAVVTDFGLARDVAGGSPLASISDTGTVVGTPAYMAPEQVEGAQLTPAADLYALGIVAYEMVTGVRPFDGGSAITVAVRRLREAPAPPRTHVPDVHPAWEAAILRCLEIDPASRFPTAGEFVRALETPSTTVDIAELPTRKMEAPLTPAVPAPPVRPKVSPWLAVAAGGALLLAAAALWRSRGVAPPIPPPATPSAAEAPSPLVARQTLAVLGFANTTGAAAAGWLSTAIAEMLTTDLAAGGRLRTVAGSDIARAVADAAVTDLAALTPEQAAALRRQLGADLLVTGSYTLTPGAPTGLLRVDLRLLDATSGAVTARGAATGNEGQLFDIVFRAGAAVREKLGLGRVAPADALAVEAVLPANPEAARLYVQGIERLRQADAQGSRAELEKAILLAPKHPLPHAALAAAWTALGYDTKARKEAKEAAGLAGALPKEMREAIEARVHEAEKDWDEAAKAYRALASSFPDDLDYGLKLAEVETLGGKAKQALVTLEALRRQPGPSAGDPRIDLAEARAHQELGEAKEAQAAAAHAAEKAKASGARVLQARALALESTARHNQGDTKGGVLAAEEAKKLFEAAGDRGWAARCLERMGLGLYAQGDLRGAARLFESALSVHRRIGDVGSVARVLNNMATNSLNEGKLAEAQALLDQALLAFRQIDARYEAAATLSNMGAQLYTAGELGAAQRRYQQALGLFQEIGEKSGIATTLTNLAEVYFVRGDLDRAQQLHEEALALNREIGDKAGAGYGLFRLGELFAARGDLKVARDRYEEGQRLQADAGDKLGGAQTRLGLAALALAEGQAPLAEPLAREAEEVLRAEGAVDLQTLALVTLGESLFAQKRLADAKGASDRAQGLLENADRRTRMSSVILAARIEAASGESENQKKAIESLTAALADATRRGLVPSQYEARLALGRTEIAAGKTAEGRARLKALARETGAKGFGLIAKQAQGV
jgi:serine/threonine protein kinase/tetratricopeptide (TPR) repeat protein/TolB-like protein